MADDPDYAATVEARFAADVEEILSHRHDLGADFWTTPDGRLGKGAPFGTLECVEYLLEFGLDPAAPVMRGAIDLILGAWQPDGRFRLYPKSTALPCHTTSAVRTLCHAGLVDDPRVRTTLRHLLESRWDDGGWRCNKNPFGRGPESEHSNPLPTLVALDAFRFSGYLNQDERLDAAVDFLLSHWDTKAPIGPCRYGIGTLFMQAEYPFRTYNLFFWVHVLSFYDRAKNDRRFTEALDALSATLVDGQMVVERVVPKLAKLSFCAKGQPSELATRRYREILTNLGR
ncbi:MAG: hypothetical protein FWD18_00970 [Micrococcales bacterium]|nr:hypothetical protein [Micrococcales bacterium]